MINPILYLMSKYSGREAESLKENQDVWLALDAKGFTVYSPICESHNIEEYRKSLRLYDKNEFEKPVYIDKYKEPDYVARDLRLIDNFKQVVGVVLPSVLDYNNNKNCVSADCIEHNITLQQSCTDCSKIWNSKGAKAEYDFCKDHHILVISLETALTVPREQWEMHNL